MNSPICGKLIKMLAWDNFRMQNSKLYDQSFPQGQGGRVPTQYFYYTTVMGNSDKMCHASLQQNSLMTLPVLLTVRRCSWILICLQIIWLLFRDGCAAVLQPRLWEGVQHQAELWRLLQVALKSKHTLTERNAYIQMTLGIILAIPTFMMPTKAGAAVRYLKITADQQIITFSTLAE